MAFLTEVCRAVADSPRAAQFTKHDATELRCGGYKDILKNTSFEEFLWHLQRASDVDARHELLRRIYAYPTGCFNSNHLAVATLLHQRIAVACFTTNFDNGIEEAFYYLTDTSLGKLVCPHDPLPHKLPDPHGQPLLIKLHEDAIAKNCVATSPELFEKGTSAYQGLPTLLRGHLTLLLGYSGTGDIDIAPHLKSVVADLIWSVPPQSHNAVVHWAERLVECDLSSPDPTQNLLMGLAGKFAKYLLLPSSPQTDLGKILDAWFRDHTVDEHALIFSLFKWRHRDVPLHLGIRSSDDVSRPELYLQAGAYFSAWLTATRVLKNPALRRVDRASVEGNKAFALWRLGWISAAEKKLQSILIGVGSWTPLTEEDRALHAEILLLHLEVCADILRFTTGRHRLRRKVQTLRVSQSMSDLETYHGFLAYNKPNDLILAKLVNEFIAELLGAGTNAQGTLAVFEDALSRSYLEEAAACGRCLPYWRQHRTRAWQQLRSLDARFRERGNIAYVRKSHYAYFEARWLLWWPELAKFVNAFLLIGFSVLSEVKVLRLKLLR